MGTLNLKMVAEQVTQVEAGVVDTSEIVAGSTVNVRPLSAYEFRKLGRLSVDWALVDRALLKAGGYKAEELPRNPDFDEAMVVTGWCAMDDKGRLVFGSNPTDAVNRVQSLPSQCRAAIDRIHIAVLKLSGLGGSPSAAAASTADKGDAASVGAENGDEDELAPDESAIETAEKN